MRITGWIVVGVSDRKIIKTFGPWDSLEDAVDFRLYLLDPEKEYLWKEDDVFVYKLEVWKADEQ